MKMVLLVGNDSIWRLLNDEEVSNPELIYTNFPDYTHHSQRLVKLPETTLGVAGVLYVNQREFAATVPEDKLTKYIGSDSATTCNIVCIRHTGSRAVCLSHLDGSNTEGAINSMVKSIQALTKDDSLGRLELHIIGGYSDERDSSKDVTRSIITACVIKREKIFLKSLCVLSQNTEIVDEQPRPKIYGIAVDVHGDYCFPAKFIYKGPDIPVRTARLFRGTTDCLNIYDCQKHELQIGPFDYTAWPDAGNFLLLPDALIREYLSTSPSAERADFAYSTKEALKVFIAHPEPLVSFFGNQPRKYYRNDDGLWELYG